MSKRIIYCADGTWDTSQNHTNVYTLHRSLKATPDQLPFYDDGVGADGNPSDDCSAADLASGCGRK